jgi:hypothetical protein
VHRRVTLAFILAACGGGSDPGDDDATPILDRTPRLEHACTIAAEVTVLAEQQSPIGYALAHAGGVFLLALGGYDSQAGMARLDLAELSFDPVELAPPRLRIPGWGSMPSLADRGATMGLAWLDQDQTTGAHSARIRILDQSGAVVSEPPPTPFPGFASGLDLIATDTGYALLFASSDGARVSILDETGAPTGGVRVVTSGELRGADLVRHGAGFLATWADPDGVHAVRLDAAGALASEPVRLSPVPRDRYTHSWPFALAVDDVVVIAWVEGYHNDDWENPRGHSIVRIARVDAAGAPIGASVPLHATEEERVNDGPSLARVGDAVAVAWSHGTIIHICAGCISDNTMRLVLFDPADLAPVSDVVELVGPSGLHAPPIANAGGDIGLFLTVDYHAIADYAAAQVRCALAP